MGLIHGGVPRNLALALRDACGTRVFVETGTYRGDTTAWAAGEFADVYTIEHDAAVYETARRRLAAWPNVTCLHGDSRSALDRVLRELQSPPLLWLDAHHCGDEDRESPLLEELDLINRLSPGAILLIDDARFVLSPYAGKRLCELDDLCRALDCRTFGRYLVVIEDVVAVVPERARPALDAYCREATLREWGERGRQQHRQQRLWRRVLRRIQRGLAGP